MLHFSWADAVSLLTLTGLEIVLGIDNLVFISILTSKLPAAKQGLARKLGLSLAVLTRVGFLFAAKWATGLTAPLIKAWRFSFSGRDLILLVGGLFLIAKSTYEIHDKLESIEDESVPGQQKKVYSLAGTVIQIMLLDIIFSIDSVITAVGISGNMWVMVPAILLATGVMVIASSAVSKLIQRHPTLKMLALSFLILIGAFLLVDGFGRHIPREYLYFAMGFSLAVELLNMALRRKSKPVSLRRTTLPTQPEMPA